MATLEEQLADLQSRMTKLETAPANKLTEDDLKKALDDHPDFRAIREFVAKWGAHK
jgi:hypothetical protein